MTPTDILIGFLRAEGEYDYALAKTELTAALALAIYTRTAVNKTPKAAFVLATEFVRELEVRAKR